MIDLIDAVLDVKEYDNCERLLNMYIPLPQEETFWLSIIRSLLRNFKITLITKVLP